MENLKLGQLITDGATARDAIHIAVMPVTAGANLSPGEHVGFPDPLQLDMVNSGGPEVNVGIIDHFLKGPVKKGERCYLFLYPNTITSLKHEWSHPEIDERPARKASLWLKEFCADHKLNLQPMVQLGIDALDNGWATCSYGLGEPSGDMVQDIIRENQREFLESVALSTGRKVPSESWIEQISFSCAC